MLKQIPPGAGGICLKPQTGYMENGGCLDATGGFGQPRHLASAFSRSGGEQLINVLQFIAGHLGENPHHGGDAVFLVIILEHIDDFPMLFVEFTDAL